MINRRNFLQHAGAVSLAGIGATLASIQNVQAADYKALVVVFLSGGFDGNNVLIPVDGAYNDYAKARPVLALPKDSLVNLSGSHIGHQFALSPANRALATLFAPIVPPAPATFSTTTLAPKGLRKASAKSRATRSVGPPAVNGTTMVTGLSFTGKSAALAPVNAATANKLKVNSFFIGDSSK